MKSETSVVCVSLFGLLSLTGPVQAQPVPCPVICYGFQDAFVQVNATAVYDRSLNPFPSDSVYLLALGSVGWFFDIAFDDYCGVPYHTGNMFLASDIDSTSTEDFVRVGVADPRDIRHYIQSRAYALASRYFTFSDANPASWGVTTSTTVYSTYLLSGSFDHNCDCTVVAPSGAYAAVALAETIFADTVGLSWSVAISSYVPCAGILSPGEPTGLDTGLYVALDLGSSDPIVFSVYPTTNGGLESIRFVAPSNVSSIRLVSIAASLDALDINGDGHVNDADVVALQAIANLGGQSIGIGRLDVDGDGIVNQRDVAYLRSMILLVGEGRVAGDLNHDGVLSCTDIPHILNCAGANFLSSNYNSLADTNGDGNVTISEVRNLCLSINPADVSSDSLGEPLPNGSTGPEDLDSFIAWFIAGDLNADIASDSIGPGGQPNGSVGPEDLDLFISNFIAPPCG